MILGNRVESQMCALDIDVSCMVVCQNAEVSEEVIKRADEQSTVIISTPHDTFTAARLINQSVPVKRFMTKTPLTCFHMSDYVEDIKEVMAKKKYRDFPIIDRHGKFKGFVSRRRFLNVSKKKVILVDHNEKNQAVDGIEEAEIVEIIDHHKLGTLQTMQPISFRNQPVGSFVILPHIALKSFPIHCYSARRPAHRWMKKLQRNLERLQESIWKNRHRQCSRQEAVLQERRQKISVSRISSSLQ